tara:strand:- start:301 stop:597 length:297 start_codon:yes stop_codon:yes gene_type:complete
MILTSNRGLVATPSLPERIKEWRMDGRNNKNLDDQMSVLTAKIDDLIQTCGRLQTENQQLSLEKNELTESKEELLNRHREAKRKIDKVVERLRGLEAS